MEQTQVLLGDAITALELAIAKLEATPPDLEGTKKALEKLEGYLEEAIEVLEKARINLIDIQTSILSLLTPLETAMSDLNTDIAKLITALKELYNANSALKELKAKRYYSPERGWRVPRESDIALLVAYTLGTPKPEEYNKNSKFNQKSDPGLSKLLSETWPHYDANGKIGLWPNNKRIGFGAVVQRQKGGNSTCDFWILRKIERVERDVNGESVTKYDYTYGFFTIGTTQGSDAVMVSFTPLAGVQQIAMRLCRAVLKDS